MARVRGRSVGVVRPMVELVYADKGPCLCTTQPGWGGVCTDAAMRVTSADYTSGRRLL